jgi:hypothetical protein
LDRVSLKHNDLTAFLATSYLRLRSRGPEKLIFTATTGRSGTQSLTRVFGAVPQCRARHEPYPSMNDVELTAASYGDAEHVARVYRQVKSINIRRAALGHRYYFEANHLFAKVFAEQVIADFGSRVRVIHLVRAPLEVATSIFRLQELPGTIEGNRWWLDHRAPSNQIPIADLLDSDDEFSQPFYKALWYWFEVESRIARLQRRFPAVQFIRFETDWLNDKDRICALFDRLGVCHGQSALDAAAGICDKKINTRPHKKVESAVSSASAEAMLARFEGMLDEKGFGLHARSLTLAPSRS